MNSSDTEKNKNNNNITEPNSKKSHENNNNNINNQTQKSDSQIPQNQNHENKHENNNKDDQPTTATIDIDGKPVVCIITGMAGSGKTTFIQRLISEGIERRGDDAEYVMNLDPAVGQGEDVLPYEPNIDIRDTVNYKEVMKQYQLGPNGAIMTALNLYSTRFDQVVNLLESKPAHTLEEVLVDTPGQIEVFTWSASGTIVTQSLASSFPTIIVFVVDTPRCSSPVTFMSNMLYACSIMYKSQLPFLVVFNKIDVASHETIKEWMTDWEVFAQALRAEESYASDLSHSMSLLLEEFYNCLRSVGVSAVTGEGMDDYYDAIREATNEYKEEFLPKIQQKMAEREEKKQEKERQRQEENIQQFKRDYEQDGIQDEQEAKELQEFVETLREQQSKSK